MNESKKNISVAGIIFSKDRKNVLLIKRRDVPVWVLPGGGIENRETNEQAIIREIFEETGFSVTIKKKVGKYFPINKLSKETDLFECDIINGDATIGEETKDIRFFPVTSLPKKIPPPYVEWITDAHKNLPYIIKKKLNSITYLNLLKNFILHPILVIRFLLSRLGLSINS